MWNGRSFGSSAHRRQRLAFASTHSDFTKSFPLEALKTFEFKEQRRISRDPLADNQIWANDVRDAIRTDLIHHGFVEATNGQSDFYVPSTWASKTATM